MKQNRSKWLIRVSPRKDEAGMALVLVLLLLLLVSAIGLGMVFMSNTETAVNANYRDSQLAFFAMRSGMDEARDRLRLNSPWPVAPPAVMPGNPNSIVYLTNPAAGEVVTPGAAGSQYFDDEFCHEYFAGAGTGIAPTNPGAGVPCTVAPPAGISTVASISPNTGTASAVKFKWARITLKQNATFAAPNGALIPNMYVDSTQPAGTQVCYQSLTGNEIPISLIPGGYASCAQALAAGVDAGPVYIVTALAVTPSGSRRVGQYEVATMNIQGPPVALGLDGPAAVYNPVASSNVLFMNGTDDGNGYANPPGCASTGTTVPAITTGDNAGVNNIDTALSGPPDRSSHYTGCINSASPCTQGSPSVVNGGGTTFSGEWSTPAQLDNMVQSIGNLADATYTCGINGFPNGSGSPPPTAPCSPTGSLGTDANPQITYVNGDFNMGNASGAGVLIVTGTLSFNGNATFDGLILVVGQGAMSESGGGNGGFNGSVFLAKTRGPNPPFAELAALGNPTIAWNGGGSSFIQYNSCWAKVKQNHVYYPIATREEMY